MLKFFKYYVFKFTLFFNYISILSFFLLNNDTLLEKWNYFVIVETEIKILIINNNKK